MKCKEFEKELSGYGINQTEIDEIINFLQLVYISGGEIATSIGVSNNRPLREDVPNIFADENEKLGLKKQMDIILPTGAEGTGENRVYFQGLTERGFKIASDCFAQRVELYKEDIENILKNYSKEFLFAFYNATFDEIKETGVSVFQFSQTEPEPTLERLYWEINSGLISPLTRLSDLNADYASKKSRAGGLMNLYDSIKKENIKKLSQETWDKVFSIFLIRHSKLLSEESKKLFEEMEALGLATMLYNGVYIMPFKELNEFIKTRRPSEEYKILKGFWTISLANGEKMSKKDYLKYLHIFGIEEEAIETTVQRLHSLIPESISPYNRETENFPFLIYQSSYIDREFISSLEMISISILSGSRGNKNVL